MIKNISNKLVSCLRIPFVLLAAWASTAAHAVSDLPGGPSVWEFDLQPAASKIAEEQHWLNNGLMVVCAVIFVGVFGVMFYSIWKHRKSVGHKAAAFHESTAVEIAWTIVPFIILILVALPATKVIVAEKDTTNADLTIKVTGYQWMWGYDYLKGEGQGIDFISRLKPGMREMSRDGANKDGFPDDYLLGVDHPLVVPVNKKVRIITTSNDVIHSFSVPAFGVKQDAIPGFVRDTWFKADKVGTFYGSCTELCGKEHAYMPIEIKVLSAADYSAWVATEHKALANVPAGPDKVSALTGSNTVDVKASRS